jgi:uncharacterized protein with PIN domain
MTSRAEAVVAAAHAAITSAIAVFEAVAAIRRTRISTVEQADVPLLYKGDDFALTGIRSAL